MDAAPYVNGGIYQTRTLAGEPGLVLMFSAFSDDTTVLAIPLQLSQSSMCVPCFFGDKLMYVAYRDIHRIKKEHLISLVGIMDVNTIGLISHGIVSSFRGDATNISLPNITLLVGNKETTGAEYESESKVPSISIKQHSSIRPVVEDSFCDTDKTPLPYKKTKYSLSDYHFILQNCKTNIDGIITKYGLNNRQAVYRLKYSLTRRFKGESSGVDDGGNESISPNDDSNGEQRGGYEKRGGG